MRDILSCARVVSGNPAAAPPSKLMNSRRLTTTPEGIVLT
jgi:hypothetical protein